MTSERVTWHVARVVSGREMAATADFRRIGGEAWFPRQTRWKRTKRGRERALSAVLPGYVFFVLPQGWQDVDAPIDGLVNLLRQGRNLARIDTEWIEETLSAEARGNFDGTKDQGAQTYCVGQRVRILANAFADRLAVITRVGPKEVQADLQATGWLKGHRVTLSRGDVAPA